ncbi:asparaginase [bacterium]|nr:asparaginase [bacterium]
MYPDCYIPQRLVKHFRDELTVQEHLGFVVFSEREFGETYGYPFFLRSCAKPLQAALIIDNNLDFTTEEIALCCASQTGEKCHIEIAQKLLQKIGCNESDLKCGIHEPLSERVRKSLIKNDETPTVFHNNCVGKHIMMLALCKKNGWDIENYYELNHPVQQAIKEKIYDLCEITEEDYPITKDGCGVPIFSMPLKNMLKGYLNLFLSTRYQKITKAFREYAYIIGGENRLDTQIMLKSKNLVAKVGADGLIIIVNLDVADGIVIKVLDGDPKAREISALSLIKKLSWANIPFEKDIKTLNGETVGLMKFVMV